MSISENIETIVSTFQKGRALAESEISLDDLVVALDEFQPRYRSAGYEGASMGVAIERDDGWRTFNEKTKVHETQVHIGLGWAFAEKNWQIEKELHMVNQDFQTKVLDGYGYWYGLFRRRLTIRTQSIPENITPELQIGFDQGVGRAIWYISKGEVAKVVNIINHYSEDRRANLWQGIGVASTYVGGCSDKLIAELKSAAGEFKLNFETGIEAAWKSMRKGQL
ncbi:MAG: hypothetical protein ACI9UR_000620 [Bacteroidia bacterium]|jgi:hypothetical protein